ncbi:MFS transporter [Rhodobacter ferrooxidans]|uniref:Sodium:galactoside symporter family protein, putative n=1 Tax=Rhodobacter ferrooxidans TaxID=371731 RepID=C8RXH6_9RHOB|nr:MFS transporter [Rhodobacter sp. SW2]EEW26701.1 sodium:galactoside symporter family protein, putative [Rhodobacter sp. SW2]
MTAALARPASFGLAPWSLFAALIAAAGLPIYIHAPKVYVDEYGVGLAALGAVLFGLRLFDVVQDPALGWLAEIGRRQRGAMVAGAAALMALAMLGLFAVTPPVAPLLWFALTLAVLFTAFSFLTIAFYAEGVAKAATLGPSGHLRLAGWREAGGLIGVSVAAVAPVALASVTDQPFAAFALGFALLAVVAVWAMRRQWAGASAPHPNFAVVLRDSTARRLLLLALVNAAPVAVTSTLFLFYVESRLDAPNAAGPLLLLFFLSAAASAPIWSRLATRFGTKRILLAGMGLAVLTFGFAIPLGAGDTAAFALVCVASGAALGADMTLLPAIFARHLAQQVPLAGPATAFGLWSFVSKLSLALAAATLLPILQAQGFTPGATNAAEALSTLSLLYAALPCALKLLAIALLATTPVPEV